LGPAPRSRIHLSTTSLSGWKHITTKVKILVNPNWCPACTGNQYFCKKYFQDFSVLVLYMLLQTHKPCLKSDKWARQCQ
jgi:hypothetical protein